MITFSFPSQSEPYARAERVLLETKAPPVRSILLVEPRGEVYARLAADFRSLGIRTLRAASAADALRFYAKSQCDLVIITDDLPDIEGRFLCCRLRWSHPEAHMWLYGTNPGSTGHEMAAVRMADRFVVNDGNLWHLSEQLTNRLRIAAVA